MFFSYIAQKAFYGTAASHPLALSIFTVDDLPGKGGRLYPFLVVFVVATVLPSSYFFSWLAYSLLKV
jgi:hypothetical protein